jgi:hypothetical protein
MFPTVVSMVRCKNTGGAFSDEDESPPRLSKVARGKRIKVMARKKKKTLCKVLDG